MDCKRCIWYDALAGCGKVKWDERGHCMNFEGKPDKTIIVVSECWKCKKHDGKKGCGVADFNDKGICNNFESDEKKEDKVNHPKHYEKSCSLECIEAMELLNGTYEVAVFCFYNAFKYLWRYKHKNGKEDLSKAKWYIDRCFYYNSISDYDLIDKDRLNVMSMLIMEKLEGYEK